LNSRPESVYLSGWVANQSGYRDFTDPFSESSNVPSLNVRGTIFVFGCFRLDVQERLLEANGKRVALAPKVFDLLVLLLQNPGKLLEKEWLLNSLWPETFVEEANLSVNISTLRRALEVAGGAHYIETIPKRGYRLVVEVQVLSPIVTTAHATPEAQTPRWTLPLRGYALGVAIVLLATTALYFWLSRWNRRADGPVQVRSIAILPFRPPTTNVTSKTDDAYLGTGISEAVIRKLRAVRKVTVRGTLAVQKIQGANVDPIAAGRELKVDVVLDGAIERADKAIRVSVQLLRVSDGTPVWADRFDDYVTNIFQAQDSISERIVSALSMKLTKAETPSPATFVALVQLPGIFGISLEKIEPSPKTINRCSIYSALVTGPA